MTDVQDTQPSQDAPATPRGETSTPDAEISRPNAETSTPTCETSTSNAETSTPSVQAAQNAPVIPSSPDLAEKAGPLDDLIASIRMAVAPGASTEARAVGATACRSILAALETKAGQPLTAASPTATVATSPLAAMLAQLAAMPLEQMLEFITNFLRAKLPQGTQPSVAAGPRFHLIQIPQVPLSRR